MPRREDGYGIFTGYTRGYYRRLSPNWLRFLADLRGIPYRETEPFRYFELGFGQGVSLNVHAAANRGEYWGNDYNPEHVEFAREMAQASGANLHLLEDSFEDLAERSDLPQFQVIVAHGIWSWISDSTRKAILRFLDQRLAPGGLFYVSYNALPGSASAIALQRFLSSVSRSLGNELSEDEKFDIARAHLGKIKDETGSHFEHYPRARERLEKLLDGTSAYYLHEYTVGKWQPMLLQEVAAELEGIGLAYCGSAHLVERDLSEPRVQQDAQKVILGETLRDFCTDRAFRNDIFWRPLESSRASSAQNRLINQEVALAVLPDEVELVVSDRDSKTTANRLRALFADLERYPALRAPLGDLISHPAVEGRRGCRSAIVQATNAGILYPASGSPSEDVVQQSAKLNTFLAARLTEEKGQQWRASPILGAAVQLPISLVEDSNEGASTAELLEMLKQGQIKRNDKLLPVESLKAAANTRSRQRWVKALQLNGELSNAR